MDCTENQNLTLILLIKQEVCIAFVFFFENKTFVLKDFLFKVSLKIDAFGCFERPPLVKCFLHIEIAEFKFFLDIFKLLSVSFFSAKKE